MNGTAAGDRRETAAFWVYVAHLAGLFGLAVSNALLAGAILLTPWRRLWGRLVRRSSAPLQGWVVGYALLLVSAVVLSTSPNTSWPALGELFNLGTFFGCLVLAEGARRAARLADAIVALATLEALLGIAQHVVNGFADRIRGTLSHYMTFAGILMVADLLLLAELAAGRHRWRWRWLALVPINAALFGSLTRTAWVGLAVGAVALLVVGRRRLVLATAGAILLALVVIPGGTVAARAQSIVDLDDQTNYDRLCMAWSGVWMVADRPIVGHGPQTVAKRYPIYRHPTAPRASIAHLHNAYLQLAAERGLPALGVFLVLLVLPARRALGVLRRSRPGPDGPQWPGRSVELALGSFASLVALAVAGLFENNWGDTEVQRITLVMMALPFCLRSSRPVDESEATSSPSPAPAPAPAPDSPS